jgi:hypothetical protein
MRVIMEQLMEWRLAGETEVLGENLPQRHFAHHKIPHNQTRARTRAAAVGSQRLTAWAMARPRDRLTASLYVTLYPILRQYEPKFFNYFRMSVTSFDNLLELIKEEITADANEIRYCISPQRFS